MPWGTHERGSVPVRLHAVQVQVQAHAHAARPSSRFVRLDFWT